MNPIFDYNLLIKIFISLPIKTLLRFKCVCKSWSSIINDPTFIKCFQSRPEVKPHLVLGYRVNQGLHGLRFFISSSSSSSSHSIQPPLYSLAYRLSRRKDDSRQVGYDCVNGLICDRQEIWNPCTGKILQVPLKISFNFSEKRFLGYDPDNFQYKILSLSMQIRCESDEKVGEYRTITLGENLSSWRILDSTHLLWPKTNSVCINGIVYYFSGPLKERIEDIDKNALLEPAGRAPCSLVKFKVKTEELDIIQIQDEIGQYLEYFKTDDRGFDLWIVEDVENNERWSKLSFSLDEDIFYYETSRLGFISVDHESGEIMLSTCDYYGRIYVTYIEINTNIKRNVLIHGVKTSLVRGVAFKDYTENIIMF